MPLVVRFIQFFSSPFGKASQDLNLIGSEKSRAKHGKSIWIDL
jgi:hypothetical protein